MFHVIDIEGLLIHIIHHSLITEFSADTVEVPTIHAFFIRSHVPTILDYSFPASNDAIYADLVDWIASEGLGGDRDAAEWVLLASIARVFVSHSPFLSFVHGDAANREHRPCCHLH
jgi:hypothetical protein